MDTALEVLDLHSILTPINLKTIETKFNPYKNNQIYFEWYNFDYDSTFQNLQESGSDYTAYKSLKHKYNSGKKSLPWIMGFLNHDNVLFLQNIVTRHYPHIFDQYNKTIKAFQKETKLENTVKRVARELDNKMDENELQITNRILLERQGKYLTPQETQALIVKYNELVQKNYILNRKIHRLQQKITELTNDNEQFDTEKNSSKLLEIIEENINKVKLGSTIFVDSKKYLLLVFSQPCINCGNNQISKRTHIVDTIGFSVKCQIICHLC
ncbi:16532_t:CDS:2, partial [Dentiscutata heterogama]